MFDLKTPLRIALLTASSLSGEISHSQDIREIVEQAFRRSILKVDVSTPTPVFSNGINICRSEGTAFLIGENLAVTASHVYALEPSCGTPTILLESAAYKLQVQAEVVGVAEDITLLKVDGKVPSEMCTLALSAEDAAAVNGVRFGIPQGMKYPTPKKVLIGEKEGDFMPFVELTPTPAEQGESGGPVVYEFSVVGVLRAKHAKYPAYSVMTPIGQLRTFISTSHQPFILGGKRCNPVDVTRTFQGEGVDMSAKLSLPSEVVRKGPNTHSEQNDCPTCSISEIQTDDQTVMIEVWSRSANPSLKSAAISPEAALAAARIAYEASQTSATMASEVSPTSATMATKPPQFSTAKGSKSSQISDAIRSRHNTAGALIGSTVTASGLPKAPPSATWNFDRESPTTPSHQSLRDNNWQNVKRVSDDIAKETKSRAWNLYIEELTRDTSPTQ
ncbi:hypothetical protein [Achromobacter mucicolens]|uniref:hypothetical protein n=1 Tax=Achromobacter mucicolens TaxID=1389922 RepID=UPI0011B26C62|nr:hypothetical protein [Achromobacter mucicolens]